MFSILKMILNQTIIINTNSHRAYENYALGISKALDNFEREMLKYNWLDLQQF